VGGVLGSVDAGGAKPQFWDDWFGDKRDESGALVPLEDWKGCMALCALAAAAAAISAVYWLGIDIID
jgi:hypothetical protein